MARLPYVNERAGACPETSHRSGRLYANRRGLALILQGFRERRSTERIVFTGLLATGEKIKGEAVFRISILFLFLIKEFTIEIIVRGLADISEDKVVSNY
jgi:hypothetical protein